MKGCKCGKILSFELLPNYGQLLCLFEVQLPQRSSSKVTASLRWSLDTMFPFPSVQNGTCIKLLKHFYIRFCRFYSWDTILFLLLNN